MGQLLYRAASLIERLKSEGWLSQLEISIS